MQVKTQGVALWLWPGWLSVISETERSVGEDLGAHGQRDREPREGVELTHFKPRVFKDHPGSPGGCCSRVKAAPALFRSRLATLPTPTAEWHRAEVGGIWGAAKGRTLSADWPSRRQARWEVHGALLASRIVP